MKKTALILILLLFTLALHTEEESIYRLDTQAGLSNNCVNDVMPDSRRFLWIGTNEGLDFYDGCSLVRVDFPESESRTSPVVFSLSEDSSGTIWIATSDGVFRIGKDRRGVQRYSHPEVDGYSIRQMCLGKDGSVWIARRNQTLIRIDTETDELTALQVIGKAVCSDGEGRVYILTSNGHILVSPDGSPQLSDLLPSDEGRLSEINASRIVCAGGRIFLSAENEVPYILDPGTQSLMALPSFRRLRDVIRHSSGEYWLAARDGIHVLDSSLQSESRIIRPFSDNSFRCLSEDANGDVWAGTLFEGLAQFIPDEPDLRHYSAAFAGGNFKARDFAETPDGRMWIGSDTRGLMCIDPSAPARAAERHYFPGRNVTGLMAEGGKLWVGTIDDEIPVAMIDSESGRTTYLPGAGRSAYAFCRDGDGRIWIGGKDGVAAGWEMSDGSFKRDLFVPTEQVCRIIQGADGSVWTASISGRVLRYYSGAFTTYKIPISNTLTDLEEDREGRLFVSAESGGLWLFDATDDRFHPYPAGTQHLLKIAREPDGNLLWITGADGIEIINPDDERPLPVIPREVLGIDGFNYSSNFISSDGTLYAGTSDGFISFSVKKLLESSSAVEGPVISSFRILSSSGEAEGRLTLCPVSMNLGRKARSFTVNVSPLDYYRFPRKGLFWKIDGLGDWTPVQDGSFTVYDIPSGKWKLRLKAISLAGDESPETEMSLRVQPPLLLSPVAFLLYLIFIVLTAIEIAVVVNRRAKAKAEREHERKLLESKMDFLTSIAHEIRTPLSLVQIPLEALIRKFASSPDGSVQENLDIMRRNSLKLTVLINELLDFRKLTDSTFQVHPEFLDVRGILKDAHRRFLPMFLQEGKTVSCSVPDSPVYCETDVRSLGRIFDNLLSNALKYSSHHTSIELSASGHDAVVSVENDGPVLPEEVREEIFKPFYRYEDDASANVEGTGLGLSTSRQFASLLGGSLTMDDDLSVNRFIFRIPLSEEKAATAGLPSVETKDRSVMVIEDDKDMARVIGDVLSEAYSIIYASNGKQALEKIEAGASPSLVVSDVIMPEMDGIAFTKALKSNLATSHIPVILLSAEVPDTLMQESLEGGADAYLEKPFSPKKLRSTVDNLIENRRRIYDFYISSLPSSGELPTGRVSALEQKFLRSIQEYVSANLHRNITLDDLAEVVCLSPSSLYKKMKEYADISPMEYVMKVRLHRAVELLKDDSLSVQEVAQAVGFNTHSFFSECFKREFGMTPRAWRLKGVPKSKNVK
ncbi:MAG: helix-turn-helix domain-containing protein [Bacteroidales bacterium]|nr:helix-turn-helix domain-containing protein [Bacteroidales bacterium]